MLIYRSHSKLNHMVFIFVAILGAIILYTGYTYNLIKPKKAALTKVIDNMAQVSSSRKQLILGYDRENEGSALAEVANELKRTSTDRFQSFNKEESLITKTEEAATALGDADLSGKVSSLNKQQKELMKNLKSTSADYNNFIKKAPANVVASLFGFRPF